jgi:hypothetical protein
MLCRLNEVPAKPANHSARRKHLTASHLLLQKTLHPQNAKLTVYLACSAGKQCRTTRYVTVWCAARE